MKQNTQRMIGKNWIKTFSYLINMTLDALQCVEWSSSSRKQCMLFCLLFIKTLHDCIACLQRQREQMHGLMWLAVYVNQKKPISYFLAQLTLTSHSCVRKTHTPVVSCCTTHNIVSQNVLLLKLYSLNLRERSSASIGELTKLNSFFYCSFLRRCAINPQKAC